jgi:oligoribonuclease NrnB/cAMP/cGMP phosphodiesterase (DHH superfamily)
MRYEWRPDQYHMNNIFTSLEMARSHAENNEWSKALFRYRCCWNVVKMVLFDKITYSRKDEDKAELENYLEYTAKIFKKAEIALTSPYALNPNIKNIQQQENQKTVITATTELDEAMNAVLWISGLGMKMKMLIPASEAVRKKFIQFEDD